MKVRCRLIKKSIGTLHFLYSPDGIENPFCFLLPSSASGNKNGSRRQQKVKDCNRQRNHESIWSAK